MIGWTHVCLYTLIVRRYGEKIWKEVLLKISLSEDYTFEDQTYYDDAETMKIFRAAAEVLGLSIDDMWEMYGEFFITYACEKGWEKMLSCMANNLQDFLDNLNAMHHFIDKIAFKSVMRGPTFQCEKQGGNGLRLHYFSHRQGLFPIVKGLVRKISRVLFEMDVKVTVVERSQEKRKSGMVEHVVFSIEPDDEHTAGKRMAYKFKTTQKIAVNTFQENAPITLKDLARIFPYHICFNKQLVVEHVGAHLLIEYGLADKKMVKLTELVQLIQPSDIQLTHKNIMSYLNTLFIFQMKLHCKRNHVDSASSEPVHQALSLKGQMMPVNNGDSIMFLCSPHVTTVRDILNSKLFISDMQMHDATRDLVMLNQSRVYHLELNKKLEDTMRKMKLVEHELETKKEQTDHLLFASVPPVVAEALRQGKDVPSQEFMESTVMFTDLPDFITINIKCKPNQIIDCVSDLYQRFDTLIQKHKCYKVLSLLDSYLIVGGVPNANQLHCEDIFNLALGLVFEGRQVMVPILNLPVRVRVGIHCGPVVAGIVSQMKPRFCVLGQTVNTAKNVCMNGEPGKILVTNACRTAVTKHLKSIFVFTAMGFVETNHVRTLTHYLDQNEKLSIWQICDIKKGSDQSSDGYTELHSEEGNDRWEAALASAVKQQNVIDALRPGPTRSQRALNRLQSVKRSFRAAHSNDSGVSVSPSPETSESVACSIA